MVLDADLARIYGVATKALTRTERNEVVTICDHLRSLKFAPTLPWAFTEHGAIMAAAVLNSSQAIQMSVFVVRAFVRLRAFADSHAALAAKLRELGSSFAASASRSYLAARYERSRAA